MALMKTAESEVLPRATRTVAGAAAPLNPVSRTVVAPAAAQLSLTVAVTGAPPGTEVFASVSAVRTGWHAAVAAPACGRGVNTATAASVSTTMAMRFNDVPPAASPVIQFNIGT